MLLRVIIGASARTARRSWHSPRPAGSRASSTRLWRSPDADAPEAFGAGRFGRRLEVLMESGAGIAARAVAGLDADFVAAGLSRHIGVSDPVACYSSRISSGRLGVSNLQPPISDL